jgi:hypothetical protein
MAQASLLYSPEDERARLAFEFDHDQTHRRYIDFIGGPGVALSPVLDPTSQTDRPATLWHLNHQRAHADFTSALSIPLTQILLDSNLSDKGDLTWWTFANHQEHYLADQIVPT